MIMVWNECRLGHAVLSQLNLLKDDQLQASHSVGNTFGINGFAEHNPDICQGAESTLNGTMMTMNIAIRVPKAALLWIWCNDLSNGEVTVGHYRCNYTVQLPAVGKLCPFFWSAT